MGLLRIVRERSDNTPVGGFVSMSEAVFHSSFRERAERPDLFAEPCAAGAVIPLVEYFADASALNPPGSLTEDALDGRPAPNHLTSFLNIAEHLIALSLAGFGTYREATRLDEKMRLRMRWMLEDDTGDKAADLRATSLIPSVVVPFLPRAAGILWQQVTADG